MIKYCAIDGGNSTITMVIDGVKYPRVFPSIQSDPITAKANYTNDSYLKSMDMNLFNKLHVEAAMNLGGNEFRTEFIFGKMAEVFQKDLRTRPNSDKYQDKNLAKWMVTALAFGLLELKIEEEGYTIKKNDNITFNTILSTGLPYREGKDEYKKKEWRDLFIGTHRISFLHPLFKGLTVDLVVEDAAVQVEGEMGLNYQLNKSDGIFLNSKPEDLINKKMGMIDIGGHTTEFVTIGYDLIEEEGYDDFEADENAEIIVAPALKADLTDGIMRGVKTIMEDVIVEIDEQYRTKMGKPLKRLTSRDIELAFTNKGRYEGTRGWILPEKIDVKPLFNRQIENLAMDITQKINALYQEYTISEIDHIFLCGGGSRINHLIDSIKVELGRLGFNEKKIIPIADPVFANAKGYYLVLQQAFEDAPELME